MRYMNWLNKSEFQVLGIALFFLIMAIGFIYECIVTPSILRGGVYLRLDEILIRESDIIQKLDTHDAILNSYERIPVRIELLSDVLEFQKRP